MNNILDLLNFGEMTPSGYDAYGTGGFNPSAPMPISLAQQNQAMQNLSMKNNNQPEQILWNQTQPAQPMLKGDPSTYSRQIQEMAGAREPAPQGITEQLLQMRFKPEAQDYTRAVQDTFFSGKPAFAQDFADQRAAEYMDKLKLIEDMSLKRQQFSLQDRQFDETRRSNLATEALAKDRINMLGAGGGQGTGFERNKARWLELAQKPTRNQFEEDEFKLLDQALQTEARGGMDPYQKNFSGLQGKAVFDLPRVQTVTDQAIAAIDTTAASPGLRNITGLMSAIPIIPGGERARAQVLLDQVGGRVFLSAYETLKGGGQITEIEGIKAEQALAAIGRAQSYEDIIRGLSDLRSALIQNLDTKTRQATQTPEQIINSHYTPPQVPMNKKTLTTPSGINFEVEE